MLSCSGFISYDQHTVGICKLKFPHPADGSITSDIFSSPIISYVLSIQYFANFNGV